MSLDAVTGAVDWSITADGSIDALAVSEDQVYFGGNFGIVGGQARSRIAAAEPSTGVLTFWTPNANGRVNALAVNGNTVYAGGNFTNIGFQNRKYLAALNNSNGGADSWNPNPNSFVNALAVNGDKVYVGGEFIGIGGQFRYRLAAIDIATAQASDWNPSSDGNVHAVTLSQNTVYAGGWFLSMGDETQPNIAAISISTNVSVDDDPVGTNALTIGPNPARGAFSIQYAVARAGRVRLELLDVSGRVVATLTDRVHAPGRHVVDWDGASAQRMPPGLYFVRYTERQDVSVRKVAVIR